MPAYSRNEGYHEVVPGSLKVNLELLLPQLLGLNANLVEYTQQIDVMAHQHRYEKSVQALTCYKSIKPIFALTMMPEIGDFILFAHSRQLVS